MKLKEIHRTATFAWSPTQTPYIATGTVAGALDESFSNESQLEIWEPYLLDKTPRDGEFESLGPKGYMKDSARYNRLAWGAVDGREKGVIAAGLENGELALWDPARILDGEDVSESLVFRNTTHTGPVRGLDFNPIQTHLLASGGVAGEVYIWDLKDPSKPYTPTPGTRSTKLDEITSVAWNQQVQYVLAGASSTGYTVVWDLRGKREVVALAYGGGSGTLSGQLGAGGSFAVGGRRGMSDIAWHPDNATRVVTASEDDTSPIIMVWDLRNARAPEKILTGHEKGVLSLSWCNSDADLLLSCGKDNRAICWNPQTSEIIGELPSANNWAFQVDWCPRNPQLLATAFFDGTIGIHTIQSTNEASGAQPSVTPQANGADIFDAPSFASTSQSGTFSLKQPPKWLKRPVSSSFGFGGKFVTVSNLSDAQGKAQSSTVHIRKVTTDQEFIERATTLQAAIKEETLHAFAEKKTEEGATAAEAWKALESLFKTNSRDELVTLLGFSKEQVAARVAEAVENLKASTKIHIDDVDDGKQREPVVSFAEPERQEAEQVQSDEEAPGSGEGETDKSETSAGAISDAASGVPPDTESTTTAPSLFGDDVGHGTPQEDFFSTIVQGRGGDDANTIVVPHTNYGLDSSVAATIGSRPSSVSSESIKNTTFRIYPAEESEAERLVTKALVLGDFESAVSLCLSSDRFADAILLAVRGGPDLLQRTQRAYFERRTNTLPYLRLFQSIVTNDLSDIVQNADLQEWKEIFVVLCTFAKDDEFSKLAEELGARLEFQSVVAKEDQHPDGEVNEYRKNATLTYLAAARLERLVSIWSEEMAAEEKTIVASEDEQGSLYSARVHALQTFVEKVTVFRAATKYVDEDLKQKSLPGADGDVVKAYKLASLYDRYFEYAELLATQGLVKEAAEFINLTPTDYKVKGERERLLAAASTKPISSAQVATKTTMPATTGKAGAYPGYPSYGAPVQQPIQATYPAYNPAIPSVAAAAPAPPYAQNPYQASTYGGPSVMQPHQQVQPQPAPIPPPPQRGASAAAMQPPPPPPKRDNGGWNDAPVVASSKVPSSLNLNKPAAITSPFPNAPSTPGYVSPTLSGAVPYGGHPSPGNVPPPPRPSSVQQQRSVLPPPPQAGQRQQVPPPPQQGGYNTQIGRPVSTTGVHPAQHIGQHPGQHPQRQPTPSQYAPPPSRGAMVGQTPPPGGPPQPGQMMGRGSTGPPGPGYARETPPPPYGPGGVLSPVQQQQPGGSYAPPPQQHQQPGPYTPPPQQQQMQGMQRSPMGPGLGMGGQPGHAPPPPQGQGPPPGQPGPRPAGPPAKAAPPPPKYPPGDRSHIPEHAKPIFDALSEHLGRMRSVIPPAQKRIVDDVERRLSPLFDALNCETLGEGVVEQLLVLVKAMDAHDKPAALAMHVDLLTRESRTENIALWMSGIKQLILRI